MRWGPASSPRRSLRCTILLKKGTSMVDDTTKVIPSDDFPSSQFPTAFADGVMSIANSPAVVKFYLFRFEPSFSGNGQSQTQPFAQVVMPIDGFAATFSFFEAAVKKYIEQGLITESRLDELRNIYANIELKR
jgi:hypothetical protein